MAESKLLNPESRQSGLRLHPEVRKALRLKAAGTGETMEDTLHRILVRELRVTHQDLRRHPERE